MNIRSGWHDSFVQGVLIYPPSSEERMLGSRPRTSIRYLSRKARLRRPKSCLTEIVMSDT